MLRRGVVCYTGKKKKDSQEPGNIEGLPEQDSGVKNAGHPGSHPPLPEEAWEKMHHALYECYFGHIDFLRLLDEYEEILGIKKHA